MRPISANTTYRFCFKCKWEGESADALCPRCRKPTKTQSFIRGTGVVLVALGGFLLAVMSVITVAVIGVVQQSGKPETGTRFTGSKDDMILMFAVFGFVLLFGLVALIAGLWQVVLGRRNMILVYIILILGAVFLIGGSVFRVFTGE
jgi:magnesium-transporting ATPase (P-type)